MESPKRQRNFLEFVHRKHNGNLSGSKIIIEFVTPNSNILLVNIEFCAEDRVLERYGNQEFEAPKQYTIP